MITLIITILYFIYLIIVIIIKAVLVNILLWINYSAIL